MAGVVGTPAATNAYNHFDTPADWPVTRRKPIGRWIASVVVLGLVVAIAYAFANGDINWSNVPGYIVSPIILEGVVGTVRLTIAAMAVGIIGGVIIAVMRQSENPLLQRIAAGYIWLFRGIPALMQLLIWFNIALIFPTINIPFIYSGTTNDIVTPMVAAVLGLGLSEAAYVSEIVRGGFLSVGKGQVEAARSIGMTDAATMRRVILPQALRVIIPPIGNGVISMLKYTALAFVIGYPELMSQGAKIYSTNYRPMEVLMAATVWYLFLTTVLTVIQGWAERRLSQSPMSRRMASAKSGKPT